MSQKSTLKKYEIRCMYETLQQKEMEKNSLIVVTANGVLAGKPVKDDPTLISKLAKSYADFYLEEKGVDSVQDNDGFIVLKDVCIISGIKNIKLDGIILFYDQIIGISIGCIDEIID